MTTRNVALGTILFLLLLALFVSRGCTTQPENAEVVGDLSSDAPLIAVSTLADLPETGWVFQGFTEVKSHSKGFEYSWGKFEHANGMTLTAMCSSPNSPEPEIGDEYYYDKEIKILIPVMDNAQGNIQRFWYPRILE